MPESIQHRADVDALLDAATNYEDRLPRDPLRKALDLERVAKLLESVGSPQVGPRTAHVAGSKGKGSTARMIAAGLRHAGEGPVGLYTSPHLEDLSERIEIDGRPVDEAVLAAAGAAVLPHVHATRGSADAPTFFELFTAMAWHAFRATGCRHVVLETGLGGRLDATNVCVPSVTLLTPIEREHTRLLGDTIQEIAAEKAGILKPGVPVICTARGDAADVIAARAEALGLPLWQIGRDFEVEEVEAAPGPRLRFALRTPGGAREPAELPFVGSHQAVNACAARLALEHLDIPASVAWRGIATTRLPGLLETVAHGPRVVIDGAHTARSAAAAAEALSDCWPGEKPVLVLAMLEEKHVEDIAAPLLARAADVVATQVASPRAIPAEALGRSLARLWDAPVQVERSPAAALDWARTRAGVDGLVLCAGSIYLAGEIRTLCTPAPDPSAAR